MDVILEVFDTFLFDRLYARVLPASPVSSVILGDGMNAHNVSLGRTAGYVYTPSTSYFRLEPSKYAYMSSWPRDYVYRQGLTLYLITWYDELRSVFRVLLERSPFPRLTRVWYLLKQDLWPGDLLHLCVSVVHFRL